MQKRVDYYLSTYKINISVFKPVLKNQNRVRTLMSEFIFVPKNKSKIFILNICLFDHGSKQQIIQSWDYLIF